MTTRERSPRGFGMTARLKMDLQLTSLVLPGALLLIVFHYLPMFGIVIAFKKYNPNLGIIASKWIGLKNFEFFFTSADCWRVLRNTLGYSAAFLATNVFFGVLLAVLCYNLTAPKALKAYHTIVILPRFMSTVIIAYIVYALLSPSAGVLNGVIKAMGGRPVQWYAEPAYWPFFLTITHIWQTVGMNSVVYYASLVSLDRELLEAADLDGANRVQKVLHVMVPHLMGIIVILTILGIGNLFSGDFGLFFQVTKDQGVLYPTTDIINTYTYRALMGGSMERSAAVGLFQSAAGCVMVIGTNLIVRKISPENSLF